MGSFSSLGLVSLVENVLVVAAIAKNPATCTPPCTTSSAAWPCPTCW